jgi:hypothetical protein
MSKKGSQYENLYTQQISEALGQQHGHDSKRAAEKARMLQETENAKRQVRAFGGLILVAFLGAAAYLINLDPANAGPCAVALGVFIVIAGIFYAMNR